ncbi:hypothetical protein O1611_g193 [Lasiodiplodia mahajangana]|uniref:Uncharacterized protein n=1 Tax=Lasiodiplodia mahajangana TaxID=1108764 RepID=A0ACC2K109_9PEZI|nr:hypothetical protein O1611_g193 [Lasiodiplodia mahajangana]
MDRITRSQKRSRSETAEQAAAGRGILDLTPTGYTFTDEMWRTQTVKKPRYFNRSGGKNPFMKPTRPAPCYSLGDPNPRGPRTIAAHAEEEDLQLWASSSSIAEYEERKQAIIEEKRRDREVFMKSQGTFHKFPLLPPELRLWIWKMAMEEPIIVTLTVSNWRYSPRRPGARCGHRGIQIEDYFATAVLPPLMLVNHESHQIASASYKRAFCGINKKGGVLAAYPTRLIAQRRVYELVGEDDKELVQEFITG